MRYPVSVFECWLLVWVLLDTTNKCAGAGLQCDAIRVIGTNETNFLAGYIDLFCGGLQRPLCDNMLNQNGAKAVCGQLGFTLRGFCSHPCLGVSDNNGRGVDGVRLTGCTETTQNLTGCTLRDQNDCNRAGVICSAPSKCTNFHPSDLTSLTLQIPLATASPPPEYVTAATPTTAGGQGEEQREGSGAIGGGLGVLAVGLGLALVGVVMGWVWHCRRHHKQQQQYHSQRNISGATLIRNPSYHFPKPHPSIQYSSQGPRDTPLNTSPTETSFATYDLVGSPTHSEGGPTPLQERVYQVLEGPEEGRKKGEGPDHNEEEEEEEGPRDMPFNTSPTETSFATYDVVGSPTHSEKGSAPLEERVYQVLEGPGECRKEREGPDHQEVEEEEGEYHVLGEVEVGEEAELTYEVPLPLDTLEQSAPHSSTTEPEDN